MKSYAVYKSITIFRKILPLYMRDTLIHHLFVYLFIYTNIPNMFWSITDNFQGNRWFRYWKLLKVLRFVEHVLKVTLCCQYCD
jgi:hypothetical protein